MASTTVVDTVTGVRYQYSGRPMGEGATAKVWRGRPVVTENMPPVAIKIAHYGTTPAALEEFWAELALLERLSDTAAATNVPWAHRGEAIEQPDARVILMELIPDEWQLARLAAGAGRLAEADALEPAAQYARLLAALHATGFCTRGDRKATDLRFDPAERRLVVLDWNRAAPLPAAGEDAAEWIRQDLRGFGRLFGERALGRAVAALPDVDDTAVAGWADLTRAFRHILARSAGCRPGWGYATATELFDDLRRHQAQLAALRDEPAALAAKLVAELETLTQPDAPRSAACVDRALTLVDLAQRAGVNAQRLASAQQWAEAAGQGEWARSIGAADEVATCLRLQNYATAVKVAEDAFAELQDSHAAPAATLHALRWGALARLGLRGNAEKYDMAREVEELAGWLRRLADLAPPGVSLSPPALPDYAVALRALGAILTRLPAAVAAVAEPLRQEMAVRVALAAADDAANTSGEQQRAVAAEYAALVDSAPVYAEVLRAGLPALDQLIGGAAAEAEALCRRAECERACDDALAALRAGLADPDTAWDDLTTALRNARAAHFAGLRDGCLDAARRADFDFISALEEVAAASRSDPAQARALVDALPEPRAAGDKALAMRKAQAAVVAEIERILAAPPFWPDQRETAARLVASCRLEDSELGEQIADWGARLARYRRAVGLATDEPGLTPAARMALLDPARRAVDIVLDEAELTGIEIVDRRWLSAEELPGYTVAALRGRRQLARVEQAAQALQARVAALTGTLRGLSEELEAAGDVTALTRAAESTLAASETALTAFSGPLAANRARLFERAYALRNQVEDAEAQLGELRGRITGLFDGLTEEEARLAAYVEREGALLNALAGARQRFAEARNFGLRAEETVTRLRDESERLDALTTTGAQRLETAVFNTMLTQAWVAAVHALDAVAAQRWAEQARAARPAPTAPEQNALRLIEEGAAWLGQVAANQAALSALQTLRRHLDRQAEWEARYAYEDFLKATAAMPALQKGWLLVEMENELASLTQARAGQARLR